MIRPWTPCWRPSGWVLSDDIEWGEGMADDDGDRLERHKEMLQELRALTHQQAQWNQQLLVMIQDLRALRRGGDNGRPEA